MRLGNIFLISGILGWGLAVWGATPSDMPPADLSAAPSSSGRHKLAPSTPLIRDLHIIYNEHRQRHYGQQVLSTLKKNQVMADYLKEVATVLEKYHISTYIPEQVTPDRPVYLQITKQGTSALNELAHILDPYHFEVRYAPHRDIFPWIEKKQISFYDHVFYVDDRSIINFRIDSVDVQIKLSLIRIYQQALAPFLFFPQLTTNVHHLPRPAIADADFDRLMTLDAAANIFLPKFKFIDGNIYHHFTGSLHLYHITNRFPSSSRVSRQDYAALVGVRRSFFHLLDNVSHSILELNLLIYLLIHYPERIQHHNLDQRYIQLFYNPQPAWPDFKNLFAFRPHHVASITAPAKILQDGNFQKLYSYLTELHNTLLRLKPLMTANPKPAIFPCIKEEAAALLDLPEQINQQEYVWNFADHWHNTYAAIQGQVIDYIKNTQQFYGNLHIQGRAFFPCEDHLLPPALKLSSLDQAPNL
ncbi:MAG: hypothetical protein J6Y94_05040 [Bacteriovoracaceae bacterium]|nr:hypothetical protein [Bacteriovoracaceae bacterium]